MIMLIIMLLLSQFPEKKMWFLHVIHIIEDSLYFSLQRLYKYLWTLFYRCIQGFSKLQLSELYTLVLSLKLPEYVSVYVDNEYKFQNNYMF